jgi:hypothetical protein
VVVAPVVVAPIVVAAPITIAHLRMTGYVNLNSHVRTSVHEALSAAACSVWGWWAAVPQSGWYTAWLGAAGSGADFWRCYSAAVGCWPMCNALRCESAAPEPTDPGHWTVPHK